MKNKSSEPSTILYIVKGKEKTEVWRISPKGLLKLIRKEIERKERGE